MSSADLMVHGRLENAIIVPSFSNQPQEIWVSPTPEVLLFSQLVGGQCGAAIQNGRLWLFRPVPVNLVGPDGQTEQSTRLLALDGGYVLPAEEASIRAGGIKILRQGGDSSESRVVALITQGDVIDIDPVNPMFVSPRFEPNPSEALAE